MEEDSAPPGPAKSRDSPPGTERRDQSMRAGKLWDVRGGRGCVHASTACGGRQPTGVLRGSWGSPGFTGQGNERQRDSLPAARGLAAPRSPCLMRFPINPSLGPGLFEMAFGHLQPKCRGCSSPRGRSSERLGELPSVRRCRREQREVKRRWKHRTTFPTLKRSLRLGTSPLSHARPLHSAKPCTPHPCSKPALAPAAAETPPAHLSTLAPALPPALRVSCSLRPEALAGLGGPAEPHGPSPPPAAPGRAAPPSSAPSWDLPLTSHQSVSSILIAFRDRGSRESDVSFP